MVSAILHDQLPLRIDHHPIEVCGLDHVEILNTSRPKLTSRTDSLVEPVRPRKNSNTRGLSPARAVWGVLVWSEEGVDAGFSCDVD